MKPFPPLACLHGIGWRHGPDFSAPLAAGDIEPITLSDRVGEGPIVLAFFPGAFTSTCTN